MHKIDTPGYERGGISIADRSLDALKVQKILNNGTSKD
jgi:hypothetical protein